MLLCLKKQQSNYTQVNDSEISSLPLSQILDRLSLTDAQSLLFCDRDNRAHSQEWLVYSYLQTGQYNKSMNMLNDLVLSNYISPSDKYYLPFIYGGRAYLVINVFFWTMQEKQKNQEIFVQTITEVFADIDHTPIEMYDATTAEDPFYVWSEALVRFGKSPLSLSILLILVLLLTECIRLLVVNCNETTNSTSIDSHLNRISDISETIKSKMKSTSIRMLVLIAEINALRWCLNGTINICLTELYQATLLESSIVNDYDRPYILHIRASELFAFYLLVTHQHYYSLSSSYQMNNVTMNTTDFPSYALDIYIKQNETEPHRAVNLLGMARAYTRLGRREEANAIYGNFVRDWSNSVSSTAIDSLVIKEATEYFLAATNNQTTNDGFIVHSYFSIINVLCIFLFVCFFSV